ASVFVRPVLQQRSLPLFCTTTKIVFDHTDRTIMLIPDQSVIHGAQRVVHFIPKSVEIDNPFAMPFSQLIHSVRSFGKFLCQRCDSNKEERQKESLPGEPGKLRPEEP